MERKGNRMEQTDRKRKRIAGKLERKEGKARQGRGNERKGMGAKGRDGKGEIGSEGEKR